MLVTIPGLESLPIRKTENGYWSTVDSLYAFMQRNLHEHDAELPRKDNIKRKLKSYSSGIQYDGDPEFKDPVSLSSVIRFMVEFTDRHRICKQFIETIECSLIKNQAERQHQPKRTIPCNHLELYQIIAKDELGLYGTEFLSNLDFDVPPQPVSTIHNEYKEYFNEKEWLHIKYIEWHFYKAYDISN